MSKFGLRAGGKEIYAVTTPEEALELIDKIQDQFFGGFWTQHKPRCPLCDEELCDHERHMNRPVGECTNKKCESTIYVGDYIGKIKDVLDEWGIIKSQYEEAAAQKKADAEKPPIRRRGKKAIGHGTGNRRSATQVKTIEGQPIFVW